MKKLLLTTALAGATLVASNAIAQTTVSGNLDIAFKAASVEGTGNSTSTNSYRGFGKEAQINIQNKGKLSNGMDYAAGFSLEDDGNQDATNFNENTFIDIISGNTTISISQDHIQNSDRTLGNFLGLPAEDLDNSTAGVGFSKDDIFISTPALNTAAGYGFAVVQKTPVGSFSVLYTPDTAAVGDDDMGSDSTNESAYEIGFVGDLGVKGLSVHAFMAKADKSDASTSIRDPKSTNLGLAYNFGQVSVGYNYKKSELTTAASGTTASEEKQNEFGLAYAVTPAITIGANYTKAESNAPSLTADAKSKSLSVGYNLGAIALTAQAAQLENYTGSAGVDMDVLYLRASTKF
jgi:hypothetical protein